MFLGIDIGTSGVKTLLIDDDQQIVDSAHCPITVSRPKPAWSEQSPDDWISATKSTLDTICANNKKYMSAVQGIGLSGQMHGATLLDKHDQVLRPCMLWNDTRSHLEANKMDSDPEFREVTGNIVFPGFTAPKVAWVAKHEAEIFNSIHKVLLPKDYVRLWLTGEYVSDLSDASGTAWLDVGKRQWSNSLLAKSNMRLDQMPSLVEGTQVSGRVRKKLIQRWKFTNPPIVAGGGGDNASSACGMGIIKEGQSFISLGTSGVLFSSRSKYTPNPQSAVHTFCHALPNTWHQMGVILSAADSLSWYSNLTDTSVDDLIKELGTNFNSPSGVYFMPYLGGERTPHNDANVRGAFLGMSHNSDKKKLTQAVLEGVSFAIKDNLLALESSDETIKSLIAVGGGSRSEYWLKLLSTILDLPIDIPEKGELGAAFGAARLAMISASNADPSAILSTPRIEKTILPNSSLSKQYNDAYNTYKSVYPALKDLLH